MKRITHCSLLLALTAVLTLGGAGCTNKAKKAYHEHRADKFYAAGQFDRAEIEDLNVLRNDPDSQKAYARLGDIYFQQGRLQSAGPFLYKASMLATNDTSVRLKLAYVNANFGNFKEARSDVQYVISQEPKNEDAILLLADMAVTPKDMAATKAQLAA